MPRFPETIPYHMYGWAGRRNGLPWLGEHLVDTDYTVVIVESVFDLAAVWPVYRNVLAPLTCSVSIERVKRIARCHDVVTLMDQGSGGRRLAEKLTKYLTESTVTHLKLPKKVKDPGEATRLQLKSVLSGWLSEKFVRTIPQRPAVGVNEN